MEQVPIPIKRPRKLPGHLWQKGVSGNPNGRPKMTEERRLLNKTMQQIVQEYRQTLSGFLEDIMPALIEQAKAGNVAAIKEIHEVIGAYEKQSILMPMQININTDREQFKTVRQ